MNQGLLFLRLKIQDKKNKTQNRTINTSTKRKDIEIGKKKMILENQMNLLNLVGSEQQNKKKENTFASTHINSSNVRETRERRQQDNF